MTLYKQIIRKKNPKTSRNSGDLTQCDSINAILFPKSPDFNDPGRDYKWKHCGKRRKCCKQENSVFPTFSLFFQKQILSLQTYYDLSSASTFTLVLPKISSLVEELGQRFSSRNKRHYIWTVSPFTTTVSFPPFISYIYIQFSFRGLLKY